MSSGRIAGKDGWIFQGSEVKRLGSLAKANKNTTARAVAAIKDYQNQLRAENIKLVLALVPPKSLVFADKVSKDISPPKKGGTPLRCDSPIEQAAAALDNSGIEVVDLTTSFLGSRSVGNGMFLKGGDSLSPIASKLAAQRIAAKVGMKGNAGYVAKDAKILGGDELGGKAESIPVRQIYNAQGTGPLPLGVAGSQVMLITDRTGIAWTRERCSLAEQLAYELQTSVDVLEGADARNAQRLRIMRETSLSKNPLRGAKCLVWCMESTALASTDWQKVPLRLDFRAGDPNLRTDAPL
jgi:hypothetical protein